MTQYFQLKIQNGSGPFKNIGKRRSSTSESCDNSFFKEQAAISDDNKNGKIGMQESINFHLSQEVCTHNNINRPIIWKNFLLAILTSGCLFWRPEPATQRKMMFLGRFHCYWDTILVSLVPVSPPQEAVADVCAIAIGKPRPDIKAFLVSSSSSFSFWNSATYKRLSITLGIDLISVPSWVSIVFRLCLKNYIKILTVMRQVRGSS